MYSKFIVYVFCDHGDIMWWRTDVSWLGLHFDVLRNPIEQVRCDSKDSDLHLEVPGSNLDGNTYPD